MTLIVAQYWRNVDGENKSSLRFEPIFDSRRRGQHIGGGLANAAAAAACYRIVVANRAVTGDRDRADDRRSRETVRRRSTRVYRVRTNDANARDTKIASDYTCVRITSVATVNPLSARGTPIPVRPGGRQRGYVRYVITIIIIIITVAVVGPR